MPVETESDRRSFFIDDGEDFDTGHAEPLRILFECPSFDSSGVLIPHKQRRPSGECLEADATLHELVKQMVITRLADGTKWSIREINPDGSGMVELVFGA